MKAILVTGSREFSDADMIWSALEEEIGINPVVVIHGACPTGADHLADRFVKVVTTTPVPWHWVTTLAFPADWLTHGKAAGPLRNQQMVDHITTNHKLDDITVLAFFKTGAGNRGTRNCVAAALAAGIPDQQVKRFWA